MAILTIDFESFYDQDYSLSRMSETDYILAPQFQVIMCAVKVDDAPTETVVGFEAVKRRLRSINWANCALLAHNTRFDGAILAWHFGIEPPLYLDTLSMARAVTHWSIGSSSLSKISDHLGLPPKGDEILMSRGKRLEDFSPEELIAFRRYCARDNDNCKLIFDRLRPLVPMSELCWIDLLLRMFITPQVRLDPGILSGYLAGLQDEKRAALERVQAMSVVAAAAEAYRTKGLTDFDELIRGVFSSNQKFAALLEQLGVEVPTKISPRTQREVPALARGDRAFRELCEDTSQPLEVQQVLAARIAAKSTIEETRAKKLLDMSRRVWPDKQTGKAPVTIRHFGARTGRPSGEGGLNWLNLRRGSLVRDAILAPPGCRIVHRDSSQVEARVVAWLSRCKHLVDAFAAGRDVYCDFGTQLFERVITKADVLERFISKTAILGLGYGCGWSRFQHMLFIGAGGLSHKADEAEARSIVSLYRAAYPEIPVLWTACNLLLNTVLACSHPDEFNRTYRHKGRVLSLRDGMRQAFSDLPLVNVASPAYDAIDLPNGIKICYPGIRRERNPASAEYDFLYNDPQKKPVKIYSSKVTENISQALSRIVVSDIAVRVYKTTGHRPFLTTYDSLDYTLPACEAESFDKLLETEFARRPSWAPGLPLASEGGWGVSLADAEKRRND